MTITPAEVGYEAKQTLYFEGIAYHITIGGGTHAEALARAFDHVVYLIKAKTNDPQRTLDPVHTR